MKNSSYLLIGAIVCSILIFSIDIQKAYAFGVTVANPSQITGDSCAAILSGNIEWVICDNDDTIHAFTNTGIFINSLILTTLGNDRPIGIADGALIIVDNNAVKRFDINPVTNGITQTWSYTPSGCTVGGTIALIERSGDDYVTMVCAAIDRVAVVNAITGSQIAYPSTLNAGAFTCDQPNDVQASEIDQVLFVTCVISNKIVSYDLNDWAFGSGTALAQLSLSNVRNLEIDDSRNSLFISRLSDSARRYTYVPATGVLTLDTDDLCGSGSEHIFYMDSSIVGDIMICNDTSENVYVYNAVNMFQMVTVNLATHGATGISQTSEYSSSNTRLIYTGAVNAIGEYYIIDLIGLSGGDSGSSGGGGGGLIGGIDCNLPENANILICRLGGDENFGGIGNSTGHGLLNVACNVIFVDCTDTNPRTNGLGLLAFIASLFVVIGMFWIAIGTEAFHMPLFVWIVIVVALSAFFTITGWIDPIFLVLTIVAIIAMAVPKIVSITKGDTLGGGSTE